jgi:hypothetical protein
MVTTHKSHYLNINYTSRLVNILVVLHLALGMKVRLGFANATVLVSRWLLLLNLLSTLVTLLLLERVGGALLARG